MAVYFRGWTNQIRRYDVRSRKNDSWLLCDLNWGSSPTGCRIHIPWRHSHHLLFLGFSRSQTHFAGPSSFRPMRIMVFFRTPPFAIRLTPFLTYVLPNVSWGCEFCLGSVPAMRLLDGVLRRWCRCLLGWPRRFPNAAVHVEVGWPDTQRLVTSRLLSLRAPQLLAHGKSFSPSCTGVPRHVCLSQLVECRLQCYRVSLQITTPTRFGVDPGCSARRIREWFAQCVVPPLERTLHDRLCSATASLAVHHVDLGSQQMNCGVHSVVCGRSSASSHARHWAVGSQSFFFSAQRLRQPLVRAPS